MQERQQATCRVPRGAAWPWIAAEGVPKGPRKDERQGIEASGDQDTGRPTGGTKMERAPPLLV